MPAGPTPAAGWHGHGPAAVPGGRGQGTREPPRCGAGDGVLGVVGPTLCPPPGAAGTPCQPARGFGACRVHKVHQPPCSPPPPHPPKSLAVAPVPREATAPAAAKPRPYVPGWRASVGAGRSPRPPQTLLPTHRHGAGWGVCHHCCPPRAGQGGLSVIWEGTGPSESPGAGRGTGMRPPGSQRAPGRLSQALPPWDPR